MLSAYAKPLDSKASTVNVSNAVLHVSTFIIFSLFLPCATQPKVNILFTFTSQTDNKKGLRNDKAAIEDGPIGKITDHGLGIGQFRLLTHSEVNYLRNTTADKTPG